MADSTTLLTTIANIQTSLKEMKAKLSSHQEEIKTNHQKTMAKLDDHQERMGASMNAWCKEMTACQEAMETCLESKEPTSLGIEFVVMREEIAKGEATVKPLRALKKRHLNNIRTSTFYLTEKVFIIKTIQLMLFRRTSNHYFHKEHRKHKYCHALECDCRWYGLMNGFIDHLYTPLRTTSNYSSITDFHTRNHYTLSLLSLLSLIVSW
jgi:hypothetical protein